MVRYELWAPVQHRYGRQGELPVVRSSVDEGPKVSGPLRTVPSKYQSAPTSSFDSRGLCLAQAFPPHRSIIGIPQTPARPTRGADADVNSIR